MLNFELVMSTVLSKVISNVLKGYGTAPRSLVVYESFSDVGESRVWWKADFQSGSRVLKRGSEPFLIYIYGIQCDFMPKSC